jgi:hypothetical protein
MRGQRAGRSWVIVIGTVAIVVGSAPLAHAQGPLDEVVDQAGDAVSEVVDGPGKPDPLDKAIDAVGDATGLDTTPLEQVKEKVDTTLDRVWGQAPDTGGGGRVEPGTSVPPGTAGSPPSPAAEHRSRSDARSRPPARVPARRSAARELGSEPDLPGAAAAAAPQADEESEGPSRPTGVARPRAASVPRVVRDLAFPFILGLAVAMFLGIQSRIDGTDSKLIQAPQETHYLSFQ